MTITETRSGTLPEFFVARETRLHNEEHEAAFLKEAEAMLVQLVYDTPGFGEFSRLMLPRLKDLTPRKMNKWLKRLEFWYTHILDHEERGIVVNTKLIWNV